ncbi:MAG: hypothetical protein HY094_04750 [Candidatus Melainabacteria bacterium]|nr:hypothetical protein [Candidatus Melainabacteria bacterium]
MMFLFQLLIGFASAAGSLVMLYLLATSELSYKDLTFAIYFGIFATMAAISFLVLTRNADNEETNPAKEKPRR